MIKLNTVYSIDNGANSVVFSEGKKGSITGAHNEGTLTGFLNGNILTGTFHNMKVNATGLIEITFHESGFDAKWKSGFEPGRMNGKWVGKIENIEKINFEYLEDYIGKLHGNEEFIVKLKDELSDFELYWDQYPQIWITKVNDVNLKPLYDYHFNNITDDDSIISILKVNDDIEDWVSDYHSQTVFSIERLN